MILRAHGIQVHVNRITVTPKVTAYTVLPAVGTRLSRITSLGAEIAAGLDVDNVRIAQRGAEMVIEAPRDVPYPVRFAALDALAELPALTAWLGMDYDGTPLMIRIPSPEVSHIIIAGTTGSGKTSLMQTIILSLALHNPVRDVCMILIDPQGRAFWPFSGFPHLLSPVATRTDDAMAALDRAVALMERRDGMESPRPLLAVCVDELADLLESRYGARIETAIRRLTQRGRGAGVHVIAATQKPSARVLGPLIKANFPIRVAGHVTSMDDARVATGIARSGAERLMGRGDFIVVGGGGPTIRFQAAYTGPADIAEYARQRGWPHAIQQAPQPRATDRTEPDDGIKVMDIASLAERLRDWWIVHSGEWGAKTGAVRVLFGEDATPGGANWYLTMRAIDHIESSTSTPAPSPAVPTAAEAHVSSRSRSFGELA